jgi:all-trans-retinol dehydrogenase (NAD+)
MEFNGKTVLITGGASGIGKIMGRKAIERGAETLIIWDINKDGIEKVKKEFSHLEAKVVGYQVDVSNVEEIQKIASQTKSEVGDVDILINNAGIVVGSYFHEHSHQDITQSMVINSNAYMHIALEFLPQMMERNSGAICNICSSASLISNPKMSVYAASKWAAAGWSDSLRLEMKALKKDVSVTTMMPYYINTGMFDGVKSKVIPILKPEAASEKIIRAIERKRKMLSWPIPYWFVRLSQGLLPLPIFEWFMRDVFKVYDTMTEFKGRK